MNRLSRVLVNQRQRLFQLLCKDAPMTRCLTTNISSDDTFGTGSKYTALDSGAKEEHELNKQRPERDTRPRDRRIQRQTKRPTPSRFENDDPDVFGTLTDELKSVQFRTDISTSKPMSESRFLPNFDDAEAERVDQEEKKFEKVLKHIRLRNDSTMEYPENYYAQKMQRLAAQGKFNEALDVFNVHMIEEHRFKPTLWLFKVAIRIAAQSGYTHMAFALFKRLINMKLDDWSTAKGDKEMHRIVSLLCLALQKSSWPGYIVRKVDSLRVYIKSRQVQLNATNYAAMIGAYGRAGAIYEAFNLVDEMEALKLKLDVSTYSNLLTACISQPDDGFRYALLVWHKMLAHVSPRDLIDTRAYALLLRAARDCHLNAKQKKTKTSQHKPKVALEQPKQASDTEEKDPSQPTPPASELDGYDNEYGAVSAKEFKFNAAQGDALVLSADQVQVIDESKVMADALSEQVAQLEFWQDIKKNVDKSAMLEKLAEVRPELRSVVEAQRFESLLTVADKQLAETLTNVPTELDTRKGHLELLGGVKGVFMAMRNHNVQPDEKTINMMLEMIPENSVEEEQMLLNEMHKHGIKMNIEFVNQLLQRTAARYDQEGFTKAFALIQEHQLEPTIQTFGCTAIRVSNQCLLTEFLADLKKFNLKLNAIMISTLTSRGLHFRNVNYLKQLYNYIEENGIAVDDFIIQTIQNRLRQLRDSIVAFEKSNKKAAIQAERKAYERDRQFYNEFKPFYLEWRQKSCVEPAAHPYAKFALKPDSAAHKYIKFTENMDQIQRAHKINK